MAPSRSRRRPSSPKRAVGSDAVVSLSSPSPRPSPPRMWRSGIRAFAQAAELVRRVTSVRPRGRPPACSATRSWCRAPRRAETSASFARCASRSPSSLVSGMTPAISSSNARHQKRMASWRRSCGDSRRRLPSFALTSRSEAVWSPSGTRRTHRRLRGRPYRAAFRRFHVEGKGRLCQVERSREPTACHLEAEVRDAAHARTRLGGGGPAARAGGKGSAA